MRVRVLPCAPPNREWESLVIRLPWKQETAGSKPASLTTFGKQLNRLSVAHRTPGWSEAQSGTPRPTKNDLWSPAKIDRGVPDLLRSIRATAPYGCAASGTQHAGERFGA